MLSVPDNAKMILMQKWVASVVIMMMKPVIQVYISRTMLKMKLEEMT